MSLTQAAKDLFNSSTEVTTTPFSPTNLTATYSDDCGVLEDIQWLIKYQTVFMWLVFVLGFMENLFVILVFLLHKSRCTVAEIYLGNLAAADLLFVCSLPFWAITLSNSYTWIFGSFLCVIVGAFAQLNMYSSIYFLLMVSIDRYLALVKTMSIGRMRRASCAKINCVIIWIFAALMSIPKVAFRFLDVHPDVNDSICLSYASTEWHVVSNFLLNIVGFLIPLIGITFCSLKIINVLRNNSMQMFKACNTEQKATFLVFAVLLLFITCWLPFHIFAFLDSLDHLVVFPKCSLTGIIEMGNQISTYMSYSNSCLNPLLYVLVGNHFRKKTVEVYRECFPRPQRGRNCSIPTDFSADTIRTSISMGTQNRIL